CVASARRAPTTVCGVHRILLGLTVGSGVVSRGSGVTQAAARLAGVGKSLFEKIWERHVVHDAPGEPVLLYVDLHLVHEVTSPQAFEGLRLAGRTVRRPELTVATLDHNVPTLPGPVDDPLARAQLDPPRR